MKVKKDLKLSKHVNKKGYNYMVAVHQENCVSCTMCEKICPDFAIYVEK